MNRNTFRKLLKITCIASVLIMMLCLCGCRARLTNNDEVLSAVYYDDEYMQYEYQMRRDELGLGKAKKPIFNGLGSAPEEEENFDEGDASRLEEYDPLADTPEPDEADPEPPKKRTTTTRRSSSSGGSSGGGNSSKDPEKKPEEKPEPAPQLITVTLDPQGGTCEKASIQVEIGEKYGKVESLPTPEREGYDFTGWINKDKEPISNDSLVRVTDDHTLFATWKEKEKTTFTVTLDANAEGEEVILDTDTMTVQKDGNYGKFPVPERRGYIFKGWYTKAQKGKKVEAGDPFTAGKDQTLYAQWERDPYKYWDKKLAATVEGLDKDALFAFDDADKDLADLVAACGARTPEGEEQASYFIADMSRKDEVIAAHPDSTVILISRDAASAEEGNQNRNLYTRWLVLSGIHEGYDISGVREDLEIADEDKVFVEVIKKADPESGEDQAPAGE